MSLDCGLEKLRAAVIDGRTQNVRYRQNELQKLHAALRNNADGILSAISNDTNGPTSEATAEYYLAMSGFKKFYQSLRFEDSIKDEYSIAKGVDAASRRVGKGLVILRPTTHTRFYSIICPIAAAIAAGNCTCLELGNTMLEVDRVLKDLLPKALDPDTFYITSSPIEDSVTLNSAIIVQQTHNASPPTPNVLQSDPHSRTIAIVDRTADIELAAKTIVDARFSFQGTSPYSPDLVVVNKFVKTAFVEACTRHASKFFFAASGGSHRMNNNTATTNKVVKEAEGKGQVSTFGSSSFVIVDVHERTAPITKLKITGCYLIIVESTSLIDSLNLSKSDTPFLAVYLFTNPEGAKFLAQYSNAHISYVNQIPLHILIGPAAPQSPIETPVAHKYSVEMFSANRPQYIESPTEELLVIDKLLRGEAQGVSSKKLHESAVRPLPNTGQPLGHAVGFFEQGIFLGAGILFLIVVPAVGFGSWKTISNVWRLAWLRRHEGFVYNIGNY